MAQYTINASHCSVFGMDVHARSVSIRGLDRSTGEVKVRRFTDCPSAGEISGWMTENFTGPHYAAYESGCTGFNLCREMRGAGIDCDVVAVTSIARSTDDKQRKTDRTDAKRLLSELTMPDPTYTAVWLPDAECEAARDLARARVDCVDAVRRFKQQANALLLRHGHVWNEKAPTGSRKATWGTGHWAWLGHRDLGQPDANEALGFYLGSVRENSERSRRLSDRIERRAQCARWKPYVDAFMLLMGIDAQTAFLLAAEIGDFSRFSNGRSASKWLGTVPKEDSSGEQVGHGHITKAGNVHCRCALVEGAAAILLAQARPKESQEGP
jgi:transposase